MTAENENEMFETRSENVEEDGTSENSLPNASPNENSAMTTTKKARKKVHQTRRHPTMNPEC